MTNLAIAFKTEMARIARKEIRVQIDRLKKANSNLRSEISALKKRADALEREVKHLRRAGPKETPAPIEGFQPASRFSPKGLASHRVRLGLSAADAAMLLGTSGQSVYNWEAGTSRPRDSHLAALAEFRKLGKKTAGKRLEELKQG